MAKLERTYNVPLRRGFQKAPRYRKTKKAVITLREFLTKHMKCSDEQLKLGPMLNEKLWEKGMRNPPHHVKVTAVKDDEGVVKAELFGHKYPETAEELEEKKEKKAEEKAEKEPEKEEKEEAKEEKTEKKEKKPKAEKKEVKKKKPAKKKTAKKSASKSKKKPTKKKDSKK